MFNEANKSDAKYADFVVRMTLATELLAAMTEIRTAKVEALAVVQSAETVRPGK